MKKAIIVGGGTGGHIIPAIVVAKYLEKKGYLIKWIGSIKSRNLEEKIIRQYFPTIKIYHIPSGKLRRGNSIFKTIFDINNILDIFQFFSGIIVSIFFLIFNKPDFIFSKGGFVSVPIAISSKILNIPFYTHESDFTVGLANKINLYFSKKFFYSFKDTISQIKSSKAVFSSNPIRDEFFIDSKNNTEILIEDKIKNFIEKMDKNLPLLLILGGSLGSQRINDLIEEILPEICQKYNIIHQTGENKEVQFFHKNYLQIDFISHGISYFMKKSDLIISRSGANLVFEIAASGTAAIFIPLKAASRGEQINNALYFSKKSSLYSLLDEETLKPEDLYNKINEMILTIKINKSQDERNNFICEEMKIRAEEIIVSTIEKDIFIK